MNSSTYSMKITLKIVLLATFLIVTNLEANILFRIDQLIYNFDGYIGVACFMLLWMLCAVAIYTTAFMRNTTLRLTLAAAIAVFTVVGFGYEYIGGTQIGYDGLAIIWESRSHSNDALDFYRFQFTVVGLVALVGFLSIAILPKAAGRKGDLGTRMFFKDRSQFPKVGALIAVSPVVLIFVIALFRSGAGSPGLPVQYKVPALFAMILVNEAAAGEIAREEVAIEIDRLSTMPHVVLILDESVRGDYLDINFNRHLTPALFSMRNRIVNYGYATSGANCSTASNLILRMGAHPDDLQHGLSENPYIWSYAKRAGYKTVYIEAQAAEGQLNNRLTLNEREAIDEFIYAEGNTEDARDQDAARILNRKLKESTPSFVFIVKSGAHFPYENSYDTREAVFRPHMGHEHVVAVTESAERKDKELMINSYKNSIQLSIDKFFETLLRGNTFRDSIVIYTSDHGQNLMDSDIELTHCSEGGSTPYEALIPLMVITDIPEWRNRFEASAARNFDRASHFNVVPTILEILGYDKNQVQAKHGQSLFGDLSLPNRFVSGHVSVDRRLSLGEHSPIRWNDGIHTLLDSGAISHDPTDSFSPSASL